MISQGIYDIDINRYHEMGGISRSGISKIKKSPLHYWDSYLNPKRIVKKSSRCLDFGSLFHSLVLEPEKVTYSAKPTKAAERIRAEVEVAKAEVERHPVASGFISGGLVEKSIYWVDEDTKILCKARPDMWFDDAVIDLKTTAVAEKEKYKKSVFAYDYHIQAAMMLDGIKAVKGVAPASFIHVVVENKAPYPVMVYMLSEETIELGRQEYKRYLEVYAECMAKNNWPSYNNEDCYI